MGGFVRIVSGMRTTTFVGLAGLSLSALLLLSCTGGGSTFTAPKGGDSNWTPPGSSSAGVCSSCNMKVFSGHMHGVTHPCSLCRREAGARHRHEVTFPCERCGHAQVEDHICHDSANCVTCRSERDERVLPVKGCLKCGDILLAGEARGVTAYCATCNRESGPGHIHGKTLWCVECRRDAGADHVHDTTKLCSEPGCEKEVSPDHIHGVTEYCAQCQSESLPGAHRHGETIWCLRCQDEVAWPHQFHAEP